MKKTAFTLAEVLITLVIIGVIAALTIPTLMNNMKDEANIVALKKFYSTTNQLLQKVAVEDCGTPGSIGCFSTEAAMEQAILRHLKINKDCGHDSDKDCMAQINETFDGSGNIFSYSKNDYYSVITLDGMSIMISIMYPDCSLDWESDPDAPTNKYCGEMYVDINGYKGPNRAGKDFFPFIITSNKTPMIYPYGGKYASHWKASNTCQNSHPDGWLCAGRFMENGWKADYSDI